MVEGAFRDYSFVPTGACVTRTSSRFRKRVFSRQFALQRRRVRVRTPGRCGPILWSGDLMTDKSSMIHRDPETSSESEDTSVGDPSEEETSAEDTSTGDTGDTSAGDTSAGDTGDTGDPSVGASPVGHARAATAFEGLLRAPRRARASRWNREPPVLALLRPARGGESFETPGRTVTEADLVSFSALTGDWHPQHADAELGRRRALRRPRRARHAGPLLLARPGADRPRARRRPARPRLGPLQAPGPDRRDDPRPGRDLGPAPARPGLRTGDDRLEGDRRRGPHRGPSRAAGDLAPRPEPSPNGAAAPRAWRSCRRSRTGGCSSDARRQAAPRHGGPHPPQHRLRRRRARPARGRRAGADRLRPHAADDRARRRPPARAPGRAWSWTSTPRPTGRASPRSSISAGAGWTAPCTRSPSPPRTRSAAASSPRPTRARPRPSRPAPTPTPQWRGT